MPKSDASSNAASRKPALTDHSEPMMNQPKHRVTMPSASSGVAVG